MLVPPDQQSGVYHAVSRIVDGRFALDDPQKDYLLTLLREVEEFCEVRLLTFCLMSNHFHLLVEVPRPPDPHLRPSPERMLAKLSELSGHQNLDLVRLRFQAYREGKDDRGMAREMATFHARLWNLSHFIRLLKQRFTLWHNHQTGRKGTLWEDRFKSILVDPQGEALITMASYIDLNPVRAGLVSDPKDYPWCGYGEAVAGHKRAREGIRTIVTGLQLGREETPAKSLDRYRSWMFPDAEPRRAGSGQHAPEVAAPTPREATLRSLAENGSPPLTDYLRCRVRYFTDGAAFGSREFVEGVFRANRERFSKKRESGARKLKGLEGREVFVLRALQKRVFG